MAPMPAPIPVATAMRRSWVSRRNRFPSRRFYRNPDCMALLHRYNRNIRNRKFLDPRAYGRRLGRWLGANQSLESRTTELLMKRGDLPVPPQ